MNDELRVKDNELGGKMNYRYRNDEEMKDSGVEWIGKIPKEWNITRVKYALRKKITDGPHETPQFISEGIPFLSVDAIQDGKLIFDNCRYISEEDHNRYIKKCKPEKNDVLMGKAASTGKIARIDKDIEFSIWSPLALLKPDTNIIKPKYLEYSMKSNQTQYEIELLCTNNTQKNISMDDIVDIKIIMPDIKKQKKIVDFLQQKTAQFDSIISKKEALIEKLEEAKKSLISEVVTGKVKVVKSSDDGYELVERKKEEMKDSGVEWLGDIPIGWNVSKIKHTCSINSNVLSENTDEGYEIKYIDIGSVTSDGRIIGLQEYKFKDAPSRARRIVNDKDILISTVRTYLKAITSVEKSDANLICSTGFAVLSPSENIDYKFLSYFIRGNKFIDEVVSRSVGVSYPAITSSEIANLEVIIPSLDEQIKIGNYIDNKINKLNSIISNIQNQIDKIKEAKQSLISEAVTGKIEILD